MHYLEVAESQDMNAMFYQSRRSLDIPFMDFINSMD